MKFQNPSTKFQNQTENGKQKILTPNTKHQYICWEGAELKLAIF